MSDPAPHEGWVAEQLREELPGLGLVSIELEAPPLHRRSPPGVQEHLDVLATRFRGADALALRQRPVPHAYRVCFRHVGLDPDTTRVPVEAAAIERLVQDALTIALVETGVPLWALDAGTVQGPLGLRIAREGEPLGREPGALALPAGRIVVADGWVALAPLFGEPAPGHGVTRRTRRLLLFAVHVDGVPALHVAEAVWACAETLRATA